MTLIPLVTFLFALIPLLSFLTTMHKQTCKLTVSEPGLSLDFLLRDTYGQLILGEERHEVGRTLSYSLFWALSSLAINVCSIWVIHCYIVFRSSIKNKYSL
ncbi:hypothetical protein M752DRAFT_5278 [Aspergillus phoenicis ATCC 13157]|uniref:Uncharacterized protein n=1 Tax=Aspergillus phoenicis ATCC 13157 TaxID=1353007 RepID=A0A370Q016_ASPPH|nr:hypothetical protein M752DRAFT_5278 [Aspergillus phoenicis ATCC 13157]